MFINLVIRIVWICFLVFVYLGFSLRMYCLSLVIIKCNNCENVNSIFLLEWNLKCVRNIFIIVVIVW